MAESRQQGGKLKLFLEKTEVTIRIKWLDVEIDHLCVVFRKKKNPTFLFISLHSSGEKLRISHGVGTYRKICVYGLQETDHCQMFNVCSSSIETLSEGTSTMTVTLTEEHDVQSRSITSILKNIDDTPKVLESDDWLDSHLFKLDVDTEDSQVLQDVLLVIKFPKGDSQHEIFIYGAFNTSSIKIGKSFLPSKESTAKMFVLKRAFFDIKIRIYKIMMTSTDISFKPIPWSGSEQLKSSEMTISELDTLMKKASKFAEGKQTYTLTHLFRNKHLSYFQNIWENDGIMKTRRKDYNGDPASCINGTIDGLFFSAFINTYTGGPANVSPYGSKRINIPAKNILNENTNMYFADFYCFPFSKYHYVTVVVTEKDSMTDKFCNNKLLLLDPSNNPFIKVCENGVEVKQDPAVEVFYTENLEIPSQEEENDEIYYKDIKVIGEGGSKMYGIPKNSLCRICSINR